MKSALRAIVLIDDNEDDLFILRMVVQKAGLGRPVHAFTRAEDAMAFLSATADVEQPEDSALPLACLVDMKMIGFNGLEFIEWVRNHPVFKRLPVIAISASDEPEDLRSAARLGAQCFIMKFPAAATMRDLASRADSFRLEGDVRIFDAPYNLFRGRAPLPKIEL